MLLLLTAFPFASWAQGNVLKVSGMNFSYKIISDSIEMTVSAPTQGWGWGRIQFRKQHCW